eukprot:1157840-Pelagomonas_calceolata.AAC.6
MLVLDENLALGCIRGASFCLVPYTHTSQVKQEKSVMLSNTHYRSRGCAGGAEKGPEDAN